MKNIKYLVIVSALFTANIDSLIAQTPPKPNKQNPYTLVYEGAITENVKGKVQAAHDVQKFVVVVDIR